MVQGIKNFSDGLRKRLGIVVKCEPCGHRVVYRCRDFEGVIGPGEDIEMRMWRCRGCGTPSNWIRYIQIDDMPREDLAQWTPPASWARFKPKQ